VSRIALGYAMFKVTLSNAERSTSSLDHLVAEGSIKSIANNNSLNQLQKAADSDNCDRRRLTQKMIRCSGYHEDEHKTIYRGFLNAVERGVSLERVEDAGYAVGDKGRINSRTTAKAISILRSLDIKLEDHGLDGHTRSSKSQALRNNVKQHISTLNPFHIKNIAKAGTNFSRFTHLPLSETSVKRKIDKTLNQTTPHTAFDIGVTSGGLIEYSSGIAVAIINLKSLLQEVSETNITRKKVDQCLSKLEPLLDKKAELIARLTLERDESSSKPLTEQICAIDKILKEASFDMFAISQQIEHAKKTKHFKDISVSSFKILRYVAGAIASGLALASQLSPGGGMSLTLLNSSFGTAAGAGGLATVLDIDSLISTVKKSRNNESFKSGLQVGIAAIDKKINRNENQIRQLNENLALALANYDDKEVEGFFENVSSTPKPIKEIVDDIGKAMQDISKRQKNRDLALMILGKQPSKATNTFKVGSNILTTGGYVAGSVSAGSGIAILAGLGGATGVFLLATPVGWALGGSGAAIALGLFIHKAGLHYVHHQDLSKTIKDSVGENNNIREAVAKAKQKNKTLGPAHDILLKHLEICANLPKQSSRALVSSILDSLIDEMGDFLENEQFLPDISKIKHENKTNFILNNPFHKISEYQEVKKNSATFNFIISLFPESNRTSVDGILDKVLEAIRLGQAEMAREMIAALLNIALPKTKIFKQLNQQFFEMPSTHSSPIIEQEIRHRVVRRTKNIKLSKNLKPIMLNEKGASNIILGKFNFAQKINSSKFDSKNTIDLNLAHNKKVNSLHIDKGIQLLRNEHHAKLNKKFYEASGKGNPLIARYILAAKVNSQDKATKDDAMAFAEHRLSELMTITVINNDKSTAKLLLSKTLKTIILRALVQQEREICAFTAGGLIQLDTAREVKNEAKNTFDLGSASSMINKTLISFIGDILNKYFEEVAPSPSEQYELRKEYDNIFKTVNSSS
jgi:hypothetical protein